MVLASPAKVLWHPFAVVVDDARCITMIGMGPVLVADSRPTEAKRQQAEHKRRSAHVFSALASK